MKTIRNSKLFHELQKNPEWETLFQNNEGTLKDNLIPILFGGLDHIEMRKNGVYFIDIGCNGKDNSFVIRPESRENKGGKRMGETKTNPSKDVYFDIYIKVNDRVFQKRIHEKTEEYWQGITEKEALNLSGIETVWKVTVERERIK